LAEVKTAPGSAAAWGKLGMVLQHYEFKAEARESFAQAEKRGPKDARWPHLHGLLLVQEDVPAAVLKFQRATELAGRASDAPRLRLANALKELGRFDEAARHFEELARARPDHAAALLGLAEIRSQRGELREAAELLRRCFTDRHTARRAHGLLASVERKLGNIAAADAAAKQAAASPFDYEWPDSYAAEAAQFHVGLKAWSDEAEALIEQGRFQEAAPLLDRLMKEYPRAAGPWLLLARARLGQQDCAGAEQALRRHLEIDSGSVSGHAELGIALLCQERYEEAAAALASAVRLKPDLSQAHYNLGFALARAGQGRQAIEAFREAIRYSPDFVDPYITLADLLNQTGQRQESLAHLRRALELSPGDERAKALLERVQQTP
jgi:tetratricopeptide (TPR) repeat protein